MDMWIDIKQDWLPKVAQAYGIDYEETYSPIAKMTIVKVIIAMATTKGWSLHQMDVKNVFLHRDLYKEVYME
jgi:hypothetical protein